jgi:hypothetical protein
MPAIGAMPTGESSVMEPILGFTEKRL